MVHVICTITKSRCDTVTDGNGGEIDIGGPGNGDYDQRDEDDDSGVRPDTQERRMAPVSVLARPGLLAGSLTSSVAYDMS